MRKRLPFFLIFFLTTFISFSQTKEDTAFVLGATFANSDFNSRQVTYGFKKDFHTLNPFYHIFSSAMYVYQSVISQELMRSCVFEPSCSQFSKELITTYGLTKGVFLTSDRMTRCTRIALVGKEDYYFDNLQHKIIETSSYYGRNAIVSLKKQEELPAFASFKDSTASLFAKEDFEFANYLIGNDMKEDALTLFEEKKYYNSSLQTQDSINYIKGWTYYSNKKLSEASYFFSQVSDSCEFYPKSVFFSAISLMHDDDFDASKTVLSSFKDSASYSEVYAFESAGLALLKRDFGSYDYYSRSFTHQDYTISEQQSTLAKIAFDLRKHRDKSPWLAGVMSSLVPGIGKIYAGKIGEGVSSFLFVGSLAALTAENWVKSGILNWKTILFGLTGLTFYIGNIYGSITAARIANYDFNKKTNIALLYSIHIPLRSIFE